MIYINNNTLSHGAIMQIKKFNEKNWFEWGAPRNIKVMDNSKDKDCIYVKNLTRDKVVAFKKINVFWRKFINASSKTR